MTFKTSLRDLAMLAPQKPAGPRGTPSAAPAGIAVPRRPRRFNPGIPAVRPPSLSRFPGLLRPQSFDALGGIAL
ncbi:MAG TPA: hypothetical protein VKT49_17230 [Bryobacteraceae bacterium]|nr:hypothetical protein [Bryobacteraceae bacterium]